MAVLNVQDEFQSGDNVTATNLNNLVKDASFNADTTDNSTLEVHTSGYLKVKDAGVQTQHIGDDQVTYGKMQDVAAYSVIGNNTNATATPTAIAIDDLKDNISNATTSADGLMSSTDKNKLDGIAANANNYSHPTGDGNLHVPATGTTNDGKVLTAGSTAGSLSWTAIQTGVADGSVTTAKLADGSVTNDKISTTDSVFKINTSDQIRIGGDLNDTTLEAASQFGITSSSGLVAATIETTASADAVLVVRAPGAAIISLRDSSTVGTNNGTYNVSSIDGKLQFGSINDNGTARTILCNMFPKGSSSPGGVFQIEPITVSELTASETGFTATAGMIAYVSNGDSGSPCLAVHDGSSFKRVALGTTISAT
jgi:hypothetical protein